MHYADDSCQLTRSFGTGDEQVIAQFIRYAPSADFDFNLIGKPLRTRSNQSDPQIRFGAAGDFVRTRAFSGSADKLPVLFLRGRLDNIDTANLNHDDFEKMSSEQRARLIRITPEAEAAVSSVEIKLSGRTITLQLGPMDGPMEALRKCTTDLVKLWGLDPAEQEARLRPVLPKGSPNNWLRSADYPSGSIARGEQAIIRYRLTVDAAGQPTACAVQSAITKGDFAEVTCDLLKKRARFEPACDAKGKAMASYFVGSVVWIIP